MRRDSIAILSSNSTKDSIGRSLNTWPTLITATGNFQPLKYNVNFKPYGVTDKTSNVIYSKDSELLRRYYLPKTDPNSFNASCRISYKGNQYIIDSILPYSKHIEIYLELVI